MHSPMMHRVASGMPARASAARDMVLGSGIYLLSNAGACGIPSTIWCGWHDFVGWLGRWRSVAGGRGRAARRAAGEGFFPPLLPAINMNFAT